MPRPRFADSALRLVPGNGRESARHPHGLNMFVDLRELAAVTGKWPRDLHVVRHLRRQVLPKSAVLPVGGAQSETVDSSRWKAR